MSAEKYMIVLSTFPAAADAANAAKVLLEKKLIACANVIPQVNSFFWWEGKITEEKEVLVLFKTKAELFEKLSEEIAALHSYTVPEILALPIETGSASYLEWLGATVQS